MKNRLSLIVLALAVTWLSHDANAQQHLFGGGPGQASAFPSIQGDLRTPLSMPGRIWVGGKYADQGLGYQGSYATIGTKTRLFEDFMDGRWLFEGRGHVSENGGFFGNFGVERVFTLVAAGADLSIGGWYDFDGDQNDLKFGEDFHSWGVTGQIKTQKWDLIVNGYFPFGTTDSTQGDPTGGSPFFENRIVLQAGLDSALEGADATIRMRPRQLAFVNGSIDIGGYAYESDLVDAFGGGRARLRFQMPRGWIFNGEINYDDRFNLTGFAGLTWVWGGAGGRGQEYSVLGRDLDETPRNDHIVRFNQDVIYAIDPDTGRPYNVVHVDNTATGTETGDFESPYNTLAEAEANSMEDDVIFIDDGDGTTTGYDTGFVAKDGQLILGDGFTHPIPIANGGRFGSLFLLTKDLDGIRPTVTNDGGAGITLASRNTVRALDINGNLSPGVMSHGIFGSGGSTNTEAVIEDNLIRGAALDGVGVTNLAGDWTFSRNDIQNNGFNGIRLEDACDPASVFTFDSNEVSNNGLDGIQITNYIASDIIMTNNVTDNNGRDGVRIQGFKGDETVGTDIVIDRHTSRFNLGDGIRVENGSGSLTVTNSIIGEDQNSTTTVVEAGGNATNGLNIINFTTPQDDDQVVIRGNDINGNGAGFGSGIAFNLEEGFARLLITENQINSNGVGITIMTNDLDLMNADGTILDVRIVDNETIGSALFGGNSADGIRLFSNGGAIMNLLIDQTGGVNQVIANNGGNGISFVIGGDTNAFGILSTINATIRNATIAGNTLDGLNGNVVQDGQLNLLIEDSIVGIGIAEGFALGGNADGFDFTFGQNPEGVVSTITVRDTLVDSNAFVGFELNALEGSAVDVALINNNFLNTLRGGARPDGVTTPGLGDGIFINVVGDASIANPQIDSRVRLFAQANTVDLFTLNGLEILTAGDASVLAFIDGNTLTNNGDGFLAMTQPDLPFADGISFIASGSSSINARVTNNLTTGNAERGMDIDTFGTSTINAEFIGNNFGLNDVSEDTTNDPIIDDVNVSDFEAINRIGSTICLSMSSNLVFFPENLVNLSAQEDFVLELDGGSNGFFGLPTPPNIEAMDFGTTCDPAITAEEMAFTAAGFPTDATAGSNSVAKRMSNIATNATEGQPNGQPLFLCQMVAEMPVAGAFLANFQPETCDLDRHFLQ